MVKHNEVVGELRYLLVLDAAAGGLFYVIHDWMRSLGLPEPVKHTYACVLSLTRTRGHIPTSARTVAKLVGKSERTVRKHFEHILSAGLWEVIPHNRVEGSEYRRGVNEYTFLWHPAMPAQLRGAALLGDEAVRVLGDMVPRPAGDASDTSQRDACTTDPPVARDSIPLSSATGLLSNSEELSKQAGKSKIVDLVLTPSLRAELERVLPGRVEEVLQVLRGAVDPLDPDRTKVTDILALRLLIVRMERGDVTNPIGLLRAKLIPEAEQRVVESTAFLARLRELVLAKDRALPSCRSGFAMLRLLLEREKAFGEYQTRHLELLGSEPSDVDELPAIEGRLGEAVIRAAKAQSRLKRAIQSNDGIAQNESKGVLDTTERELDKLLKESSNGAVSTGPSTRNAEVRCVGRPGDSSEPEP